MSEDKKPAEKSTENSAEKPGGQGGNRSKNRRGGRRRSGNKKNSPNNENSAQKDADGNQKSDGAKSSDQPAKRQPQNNNRPNNRGPRPAGQGSGNSQRPARGGKKRRPNQGKSQQNRSNSKKSKSKAEPKLEIGPPKTSVKIVEKTDEKKYGVVFYDNLQKAKYEIEDIQAKAREVDQLNIVIKAEGEMNDPDLIQYGILYAGEAWHLIHTRRMDDGWYS